ncbi:MAG: DUF2848 domain-containing protein [Gammaproteobacteria bacterium]|nr:DUF2848 domain-containing protein [Gammaproteobacteria bacterium]MDD9874903.1 DUF2848 domain-containing protein [Gammaproteobacteria bacterium]
MTLVDRRGEAPVNLQVNKLVIAGWTGRDQATVEAHIAELEKLGVPRPGKIPTYYRCAASLLTTAGRIEVAGGQSSGEVEFVLLSVGGEMLVGVGSDHTDRELEKTGVTLSKQVCAKPIGASLWRFNDIAGHWDDLVLRSFAVADGARELYQEGPVTAMRAPADLLAGYGAPQLPDGTAMFCGTLAVKGDVRPADAFEMELSDPVLDRQLHHRYEVTELPVEG